MKLQAKMIMTSLMRLKVNDSTTETGDEVNVNKITIETIRVRGITEPKRHVVILWTEDGKPHTLPDIDNNVGYVTQLIYFEDHVVDLEPTPEQVAQFWAWGFDRVWLNFKGGKSKNGTERSYFNPRFNAASYQL